MIHFVDTSFFFALASVADADHERVKAVFEQFEPREIPDTWLTTNYVVMETIRLTKYKVGQDAAVQMGRRLYSEKLARIQLGDRERRRRKGCLRVSRETPRPAI